MTRIIRSIPSLGQQQDYKSAIQLLPVFLLMLCILLPLELFWAPSHFRVEIDRKIHHIQENSETVTGSLRKVIKQEIDTWGEGPTTWFSIFLEVSFSPLKGSPSTREITESNANVRELTTAFNERNVRNVSVLVDRTDPNNFYIRDYPPIGYSESWPLALFFSAFVSLLNLFLFAVTIPLWHSYFGRSAASGMRV